MTVTGPDMETDAPAIEGSGASMQEVDDAPVHHPSAA
jgi:hypothetical protein